MGTWTVSHTRHLETEGLPCIVDWKSCLLEIPDYEGGSFQVAQDISPHLSGPAHDRRGVQ